MTTPSIYVGTYHKYNCGSIAGKWLNLLDYADPSEFYAACAKLHSDETDPEYMFQDFDGFPRQYYSECGGITELYQYIDFIRESSLDLEIIEAGIALDIPLESIEDAYYGSYSNDEDFAQNYAEDTGAITETVAWPYTHIDWESAARDLMQDYNDQDGHYFHTNW